ncbi:hypothetical protein N8580_03770, partial [Akkermansiaceae bacterium]|nr:hypothetical protein [Akkermansiaceae bacterium]
EKTGLLEGLGEIEKNNMSLILENQAKQLVVESSQTGGGTAGASFTAGTGEQWAGIALPLVRKVFGQIAAKDFVSVQPMSLPSGLVFFLDFQYGTDKSGSKFNVGGDVFGNGSMYGVTDTAAAPTDGLYGAGRWTYSSNVTSSAGANAGFASASWAEVGYDSGLSASIAASEVHKITVPSESFANPDIEGARGFYVGETDISTGFFGNLAAYNYYTTDGDNFVLFVSASKGASLDDDLDITYVQQPTDNQRGDFEDGNTTLNADNAQIAIPEINIKMKSEAIVAKTKKLKAVWTPEFAQDLNAYHSLDAEAELTSIMSEYIALEIDLEILGMLIENALTTEYWSAENNRSVSATQVPTDNLGFFNTQGQWFQTLGTKINKVSNKIHQLTLRGGANFMVCSPTVGTILESIPGFAATDGADANTMNYAFGIQKVGNLNSKYEVYKNPYMTENTILLGFKGSQFLETGATFAPYIPLIMTPLVYDPTTFTPRKGLLTRYAKKMLRPEYYAKIYVNGLNTL